MYLAGLLNHLKLFQITNGWKESTRPSQDLSSFLYRATSAILRLQRMETLNDKCVNEFDLFEDQLNIKDDKIVFNSNYLINLLSEVSPLFSDLRIMQDMIFPLIGKTLKVQTPASMYDGVQKIHKYKIPEEIKNLILIYWSLNGHSVRDYRVLDQHHYNLIEHTFLQIKPQKTVLICLPDNPEIKSSKDFTFDRQIDAIVYLNTAFKKIHDLTENIASLLGFRAKPLESEMGMSQLGSSTPVQEKTLALMVEIMPTLIERDHVRLDVTGIVVSQKEDARLGIRQVLLRAEKIEKAKKIYLES